MPSQPSKRLIRTAVATDAAARSIPKGILTARKKTVSTGGGSLTIPAQVSAMVIKNGGANPMQFNFNSDAPTDFWQLEPGEESPVIPMLGSVTVNARAVGGSTTAYCLFWG